MGGTASSERKGKYVIKVWVHKTGPVDRWDHWQTRELSVLGEQGQAHVQGKYRDTSERIPTDFTVISNSQLPMAWDHAYAFACLAGWDEHGEQHLTVLPNPEQCNSVFLFAFKNGAQGGNGTCFFVCALRLAWLEYSEAAQQYGNGIGKLTD
jgi:hypothetical protein